MSPGLRLGSRAWTHLRQRCLRGGRRRGLPRVPRGLRRDDDRRAGAALLLRRRRRQRRAGLRRSTLQSRRTTLHGSAAAGARLLLRRWHLWRRRGSPALRVGLRRVRARRRLRRRGSLHSRRLQPARAPLQGVRRRALRAGALWRWRVRGRRRGLSLLPRRLQLRRQRVLARLLWRRGVRRREPGELPGGLPLAAERRGYRAREKGGGQAAGMATAKGDEATPPTPPAARRRR